jgi:hypothetical protein
MKKTVIIFCSSLLFTSCGGSDSTIEKELELRAKELELKERELALQESDISNSNSSSIENERLPINNSNPNGSSSKRDSYNSSPSRQKSESELIEELHQKEINKPKDHLSVSYKLNYKVFSGKDEIIGKIFNSASITTFKDIVLTVVYSTETETELSRKDYIVYDYVYSNSEIPFNIKTYSPNGTKRIGVFIKSAKGE